MNPKSTLHPREIKNVSINHEELSIEKLLSVSRYFARVAPFEGPKRQKVDAVRKYVEENWLSDSAQPRYGFNTGIGSLKGVKISQDNIEKFQQHYVKSHSVGVGEPLAVEIVRGAMLIQANALSMGFSGVRALVVDKLIEMLNKKVHPVVPEQGSLGASGDLAPLTHIASVLVGEDDAEIWIGSRRAKISELTEASGAISFEQEGRTISFEPIRLQGKEAVSLTNSTAVMLAVAAHLVFDAEVVLKNADISGALSLEAMMCEASAFSEDLHRLRNQVGQINTAKNISALVQNSKRMTSEARLQYFQTTTGRQLNEKLKDSPLKEFVSEISRYKKEHEFEKDRIQDAYSLRCIPQVHGACKDAFNYVKNIVNLELSAVTDNPVIFPERREDGFVARSGGNFHGEPLALAMDFLSIALSEIGSIAERRLFRMLSPGMSFGLPRNLSGGEVGVNSGYMIVQYTAAQLVAENKILAHPASVDSIPTSDNQEDHVSMGLTAARKCLRIAKNVQYLIAMEYLCAVQGLHLSALEASVNFEKFPLGAGTTLAFDFLRNWKIKSGNSEKYPFQLMRDDEYVKTKIEIMRALCAEGTIVNEVEKRVKLLV
ncbi:MAG: histidine ammonia-lyase [bacterium]